MDLNCPDPKEPIAPSQLIHTYTKHKHTQVHVQVQIQGSLWYAHIKRHLRRQIAGQWMTQLVQGLGFVSWDGIFATPSHLTKARNEEFYKHYDVIATWRCWHELCLRCMSTVSLAEHHLIATQQWQGFGEECRCIICLFHCFFFLIYLLSPGLRTVAVYKRNHQ